MKRLLAILLLLVSSHAAEVTLSSPLEHQVIQRVTGDSGSVAITGTLAGVDAKGTVLEARIVADGKDGAWHQLAPSFEASTFRAALEAPAGGWYRLEVRASTDGKALASAVVEHIGVGEVFVVAGQSNSANHGEEQQLTKTGRVASFDGSHWQLSNDPQPGASGGGGSFLAPFGDAMVERFGVPVGLIACGIGATSVREWLPEGAKFPNPPTLTGRVRQLPGGVWESKGEAFAMLTARMKQLGPKGFRAVLWHQGESDANQQDPTRTLPGGLYREYLEKVIRESRRESGWEAPWFVAQASYHVPGDEASPDIRAAQASLWKDGLALEGPDSDAIKGELRENGGKGVHFSGPGLREHAARWAEKVAPWLEQQMKAAKATLGSLPAAKVLFLGNSITLHAPAPGIGWTGNWGMAASVEEKDYVHLLTADIAKASGALPQTKVRNIADFERGYDTFDIAAGLKAELEFSAEIVVVAIGENVPEPADDDARAKFAAAFARLLAALKEHGHPVIFVRSSFWPDAPKDDIMRKASVDAGVTFVDIAALGRDETNAARSERKIEHVGVAGHPGDKGMRAIADAIFAAIQKHGTTASPDCLIGYTESRTNLPGGRQANIRTMRARIVNVDGSENREVAAQLVDTPDTWTQFAGWSPDGKAAIIAHGWESPENAKIEEEQKAFHFTKEGWLLDTYFVELATGKTENVTATDRVSFYNGGLFFWPGDASKLGFTALIDGNSHPFRMDRDGRNKVDLTKGAKEFTYGFSGSPDGRRIAYHKDYQVFLADADGSNAVQIQTGHPFNFGPAWSPDGQWVLFVSGEHYDCHAHLVRADGTGLKKLADRGGYRGVVEFLDVPDFHGGSSDTPVWAPDSQRVYYTAKAGSNVELFAVGLDGTVARLTTSAEGTLHYHPQPSPDGAWLVYGAKREGVRQLFVMRLADRAETQITNLTPGHAAMWPHWQPAGTGLALHGTTRAE